MIGPLYRHNSLVNVRRSILNHSSNIENLETIFQNHESTSSKTSSSCDDEDIENRPIDLGKNKKSRK